ncbi:MAG TPA: hypothetical protein VHU41_06850, partial [Thermoanaerobaculia bacterium]|nr:hypothetical protein [Thermoanaerobaculia bacterium]
KQRLIGEIQRLHDSVTQGVIRISHLEGFEEALRHSEKENEQKAVRLSGLEQQNRDLSAMFDESQTTVQSLFAEIRRLQSLLDMIYASKTWRLHTIVERVKGR